MSYCKITRKETTVCNCLECKLCLPPALRENGRMCKYEKTEEKMYKALLLNNKDEIEDSRFFETYEDAVKQCIEWQLKHEYDFWETKIVKTDEHDTDTQN